MNMKTITIIGCVKTKRPLADGEKVPAHELYTSTLFAKRLRHAKNSGKPWGILSAEHGLVDPITSIGAYDTTIREVKSIKRGGVSAWHKSVAAVLEDFGGVWGTIRVELHAGADYVARFREAAELARVQVVLELPVAGMQIGESLRWYNLQHERHDATEFHKDAMTLEAKVEAAVDIYKASTELGEPLAGQALRARLCGALAFAPPLQLVELAYTRGLALQSPTTSDAAASAIFHHVLAELAGSSAPSSPPLARAST